MKGKFDWIKTPIATLDTNRTIYIPIDNGHTFTPHYDKAFVTGMALHHYWLLKFFVSATRGYRIIETHQLNPSHWTMPTISEEDKTIRAASRTSGEP